MCPLVVADEESSPGKEEGKRKPDKYWRSPFEMWLFTAGFFFTKERQIPGPR